MIMIIYVHERYHISRVCGYYYHRQLKFEAIEVGSALHDLCHFDKIILLSIINVYRHPSAPQPPSPPRLT